MNSSEIYLDNAATSWPSPGVLEAIRSLHERRLGNASSLHHLGVQAATLVESHRQTIAKRINARPEEIVFTSGGTESNNLALRGFLEANKGRGNHLIVSQIEHSSVLNTARWLETQGFQVSYAPVDEKGMLNLATLKTLFTKNTILLSVVHANNEVGSIQELEEISKLCHTHGASLHVDACQSFCKVHLDLSKTKIDLVSLSAHKIHGPTGVGALYVREGTMVSPINFGGNQELGLRSGTYNVEGIVGFGTAVMEMSEGDVSGMRELRDHGIKILSENPSVILNGTIGQERLCNNINITLKNAVAKTVLFELSKRKIYVSTGSACSSGKKNPSHVLLAMGRNENDARECLRISLSKWTTREDIQNFAHHLKDILNGKT